jgi:hypothetical protein
MDSRRPLVSALAIAGAVLVLFAIFSKSWATGTESSMGGGAASTLRYGLTGGESCAGGQCQSISLSGFDENWGYAGIAGIVGGLATVGVAGYLLFLISRGRAGSIDPKKLGLPAAVGGAASLIWLFVKPDEAGAKISYAGFVAIAGFGASAGALFLAQKWLAGMNPMYRPPPLPQQYGNYYQGGYGQQPQPPQQQQVPPSYPPQAQGYYPPQAQPPQQPQVPPSYPPQPQAYGSEPPVQRIMPTMPRMAGSQPPSYPPQPMQPMQPPGSQPPVPMMQKQSTTIPPGSNPCPRCGTGLAYSSSHGKWYCARCQAYV